MATKRREVFMVEHPEKHVQFWKERAKNAVGPVAAYEATLFHAIALYSAGAPLPDVRKATAAAVAHLSNEFGEALWDLRDPARYYPALWGLSLAMLFGDGSPAFAQRFGGQDRLIDTLLQRTGTALEEPVEAHLHGRVYGPLSHVLEQDVENIAEYIDAYLVGWYGAMGRTPWHDTHLAHDPAFFGYWAFELAVVVKANDITDTAFASNIFYPRDMVHQRLFRTWLDDEEGEVDRRLRAVQLAPAELAKAKAAMVALLSGENLDETDANSIERAMGLLATVMGMEAEALQRDPKLLRMGVMQMLQSAMALSKSALEASGPDGAAHPLRNTFAELAGQAEFSEADLEEASKLMADSEAFRVASVDPEMRLAKARARLEEMQRSMEEAVKVEQAESADAWDALDKMMKLLAKSLGIEQVERDIAAETRDQVANEMAEANRKNMIGEDFDWGALFRKQ